MNTQIADLHPIRPGAAITTWFGHDSDPVEGGYRFHRAIDRAGGDGLVYCPIQASYALIEAPSHPSYGTLIRLIYADYEIRIAHCHEFTKEFRNLVANKQPIPAGTLLALEGSEGKSTGPHSHIELIAVGGRSLELDGQLAQNKIAAGVYWDFKQIPQAHSWMKDYGATRLGPIECVAWDRRNNCTSIWMDPFAVLGL
jgi:murein DD-endopeptidase MepM/ murein hydrolase activator NlpD